MWIEFQLLGVVAVAMLLGGLVGMERELADKPAGLRTHMLVSGAAALLVGLSNIIVDTFTIEQSAVQVDPIRVIEAIVAGVSFLGAGTIIRRREDEQTEGLTTAASLLFVAGIGVGVATYHFILAIGAVLLALLVLRVPRWFQRQFLTKERL